MCLGSAIYDRTWSYSCCRTHSFANTTDHRNTAVPPYLSSSPSLPCKLFPLTNGSPPAVGLIPILPHPTHSSSLIFWKVPEPSIVLKQVTLLLGCMIRFCNLLQCCETSLRKQNSLSHSCHFVPIHKRAWAKWQQFLGHHHPAQGQLIPFCWFNKVALCCSKILESHHWLSSQVTCSSAMQGFG